MKKALSSIAIEGVEYAANPAGNYVPGGADPEGIGKATILFTTAATKCPSAAIIAGGFSQGAAIMHRSIEALPTEIQGRIVAVILYGDSQNKIDGGRIKNFPIEKVKIYCNEDDSVCYGGELVTEAHMAYANDVSRGVDWAIEQVTKYSRRSKSIVY